MPGTPRGYILNGADALTTRFESLRVVVGRVKAYAPYVGLADTFM